MTITIDCDRRIRKLNIEFDDFDENESENYIPKETRKHKLEKIERVGKAQRKESLLDTSDDYEVSIPQDVIEKPQIEEKERPVMVAEEMQNLAF